MREEPQPVPLGWYKASSVRLNPDGGIRFHFDLKEGEAIRVTAGPFADVVGQLERLDDSGRVKVLLELIGGKVRVALPEALVAPNRGAA